MYAKKRLYLGMFVYTYIYYIYACNNNLWEEGLHLKERKEDYLLGFQRRLYYYLKNLKKNKI